mmetsp:Transcript_18254/g.33915  ORF Transcript_18254/g.33915 Transcript_18254/m.33915 type:complete len:296 (+) Transcript_18254:1199-2086(+)
MVIVSRVLGFLPSCVECFGSINFLCSMISTGPSRGEKLSSSSSSNGGVIIVSADLLPSKALEFSFEERGLSMGEYLSFAFISVLTGNSFPPFSTSPTTSSSTSTVVTTFFLITVSGGACDICCFGGFSSGASPSSSSGGGLLLSSLWFGSSDSVISSSLSIIASSTFSVVPLVSFGTDSPLLDGKGTGSSCNKSFVPSDSSDASMSSSKGVFTFSSTETSGSGSVNTRGRDCVLNLGSSRGIHEVPSPLEDDEEGSLVSTFSVIISLLLPGRNKPFTLGSRNGLKAACTHITSTR